MARERWTKVSWDTLPDYPGTTARLYGAPLGIQHFGFLVNRQAPGARGLHHSHEQPTEEIYVLLRGRGILWVEEEPIPMEALDAVRVPSPIPHSTENTSDEEIWWLVLGSPNDEYIASDPERYTPIDPTISA